MCEALYPKDKYPQGHPALLASLRNLGLLLGDLGGVRQGGGDSRAGAGDAPGPLPQGAVSAGTTRPGPWSEQPGLPLTEQGAYAEARAYYERALAMRRALFPKGQYPLGTPTWPPA